MCFLKVLSKNDFRKKWKTTQINQNGFSGNTVSIKSRENVVC